MFDYKPRPRQPATKAELIKQSTMKASELSAGHKKRLARCRRLCDMGHKGRGTHACVSDCLYGGKKAVQVIRKGLTDRKRKRKPLVRVPFYGWFHAMK